MKSICEKAFHITRKQKTTEASTPVDYIGGGASAHARTADAPESKGGPGACVPSDDGRQHPKHALTIGGAAQAIRVCDLLAARERIVGPSGRRGSP